MKKLKLQAFELGAREILSRDQLKNVLGGDDGSGSGSGSTIESDGHCRTGGCLLYIRDLGITVNGQCTDYHSGGSIRCACVNGQYSTDPDTWSYCNVTGSA